MGDALPAMRRRHADFKPAWWLPGPHLQTLWAPKFRRLEAGERRSEHVATPDGDFLELDWCGPRGAPLVLLVHGLTGSSRSHYVLGLAWALQRRGFQTVAMNFRGCGTRMNDTSRCYHSGETADIACVYRHLRQREPFAPIGVVGYSLGGNVVLKWLGEPGAPGDVFAAVAVSVPLLLDVCATRMDQGVSRIYRNHLLQELKVYLWRKRRHLERIGRTDEADRLAGLGDLSTVRSFWDYDQRVVAGLYDFEDAEDYYRRSSSRQFLASIKAPTLIIQARDDPFMTSEVIPRPDELSASVVLEVLPAGGHVGFLSGIWPGRPRYWLDERIPEYLRERLQASAGYNE